MLGAFPRREGQLSQVLAEEHPGGFRMMVCNRSGTFPDQQLPSLLCVCVCVCVCVCARGVRRLYELNEVGSLA